MKKVHLIPNLLSIVFLCACTPGTRYISCESIEVREKQEDINYVYRVEHQEQPVNVRRWTNPEGKCIYGDVFTSKNLGANPWKYYIYDLDEANDEANDFLEEDDRAYVSVDPYGIIQATTNVYLDTENNVIKQETVYSEYTGTQGDRERNKETWKEIKKKGVYFIYIDYDRDATVGTNQYHTSLSYTLHLSYYDNSLTKTKYMQFGKDAYITYVER